jgi:hypothetical protein
MSWKLAELRWRDEAGLYESRWERRSDLAEWKCKITIGECERSRSRSRHRPSSHMLEQLPSRNTESPIHGLVANIAAKQLSPEAAHALPAPFTPIRDQISTLLNFRTALPRENTHSQGGLGTNPLDSSPRRIASDLGEAESTNIDDCSPQKPFDLLSTHLERPCESPMLGPKPDDSICEFCKALCGPER